MKKRIYLILLSIVAIFFSCKDDSGQFEEQMFTSAQITAALQECIRITSDSTLNALCISDTLYKKRGYYYFDSDSSYRINLPAAAKQVLDTLDKYGFADADSILTLNINRAAEQCGNKIKSDFLTPLAKDITFPNPNQILRGAGTPLTDYVKQTRQNEFLTLLRTSVLLEQFNALEIISSWNMLQEEYYKITEQYVSIDILSPTSEKMVEGFFKKMAIEEDAVRKNLDRRGPETGWLFRVFAILDN